MLTLTFGFKKPETGDKGTVWFPAMEQNMQQLNDHSHNGVNSTKLTAQSITGVSATILATGWVATSGGTYRQVVTTPANVTFDDYGMYFRINTGPSTGHIIYPSVEKITNTTFFVYINDSTVDLKVLYLV
jgi:hypothetical protein